MANLLGQNIGTNYKGILNLNTLNGNLTTTLEAITDGDGNASTLLLSTTLARVSSNLTIGGSTTASARLHVRGDGTNPIARFESSAGASTLQFSNDGTFHQYGSNGGGVGLYISTPAGAQSVSGTSLVYYSNVSNSAGYGFRFYGNAGHTYTGGTGGMFTLGGSYNSGAGSANYRPLFVEYTINTTGAQTGTATGIFLNATETALNGMGHNLMDLQVGGVSRFRLDNTGAVVANFMNIVNDIRLVGNIRIASTGDGILNLFNNLSNNFNRLNLGGTTNAFPAIKRNGAAIDFRLADDSGFCSVNSLSYAFGDGNISITQATLGCILMTISPQFSTNSGLRVRTNSNFNTDASANAFSVEANLTKTFSVTQTNQVLIGSGTVNASAVLQADSTTRGFLPPRLTTAQRDLIGTPAAGLMIYNTSTNRPNFYDGSAWVAL